MFGNEYYSSITGDNSTRQVDVDPHIKSESWNRTEGAEVDHVITHSDGNKDIISGTN